MNFLYWHGPQPQLVFTQPELIKEILMNDKEGAFPKTKVQGFMEKFLGQGLATSQGEEWFKKRMLANHAFHAESLKVYMKNFDCCNILRKTHDESESDELQQGVRASIMKILKKREENVKTEELDSYGSDFLGKLLKAYHSKDETKKISLDDMIDECKTFYIAGHETTTNLLSWTILLLATHTDWQDRGRKEVLELSCQQIPSPDSISRLKTRSMIINESLRLYSPTALSRKTNKEVKLGKLLVPANIEILIPILAVHHDPKIWGEDAHLFKPERFAEGVAKATNNNMSAYLPFGLGPRTCMGMKP
ncbi:hypothetical protein Patl1_16642 [Pistacia atlantica]|uniref:Uncharacterized protein n=1 Tax=Pistacia atlantica TaxID=434234 RepID=A0ACC1B7S4_9ROSI|nr:hypothetical protein Patl1_16642 [Pistacia atlantica]